MIRSTLLNRQKRQSIFKTSFAKKHQQKKLGYEASNDSNSTVTLSISNNTFNDVSKKNDVQRHHSQPLTSPKNSLKKNNSQVVIINNQTTFFKKLNKKDFKNKRSKSLSNSNDIGMLKKYIK